MPFINFIKEDILVFILSLPFSFWKRSITVTKLLRRLIGFPYENIFVCKVITVPTAINFAAPDISNATSLSISTLYPLSCRLHILTAGIMRITKNRSNLRCVIYNKRYLLLRISGKKQKKIVDYYGNYPSFCMFAIANETRGEWVPRVTSLIIGESLKIPKKFIREHRPEAVGHSSHEISFT